MTQRDLPNLDVLRSFAVLAVALTHIIHYQNQRWVHGIEWLGLTGVCLFFVHTCLVLMWSMERDPHTGRFYIRRLFRLFPLWLVVLTVIVVLRIPTSPVFAPHFGYFAPSAREFLINAALLSNLHYGHRIVGASWSLPMEAQMYLLLPLLFFFIRGSRAAWAILLVDLLVIASVYSVVNIHSVTAITLVMCIPYFLPGAIAYALYQKVRPVLPAWTFPIYLLLMIALNNRFGTRFVSSFWCLAIGLSLPFFRELSWRPLTQIAHLIARYSYGIYLCHIPSIWFGIHFFRRFGLVPELLVIALTIAATAVLLYHLVEAPMIRYGAKIARHIEPGSRLRVDRTTFDLEPAP